MQYMLLIHDVEAEWGRLSEEERDGFMQEYFDFTSELRDSGAYVTAAQLQPTSTATAVHVQDGETITTDGPFAETKEALGGFYLLDVESLDEAAELAAGIPAAAHGAIELRAESPEEAP